MSEALCPLLSACPDPLACRAREPLRAHPLRAGDGQPRQEVCRAECADAACSRFHGFLFERDARPEGWNFAFPNHEFVAPAVAARDTCGMKVCPLLLSCPDPEACRSATRLYHPLRPDDARALAALGDIAALRLCWGGLYCQKARFGECPFVHGYFRETGPKPNPPAEAAWGVRVPASDEVKAE